MENLTRIASFTVDHDLISEGVYVSRVDGDITTYDLRCRRPNMGDYMDNITMHSVEHLFATYVRNSEIKDNVIYFGPMGCQTGFYLLVRGICREKVYEVIVDTLKKILLHEGSVPGASRRECGNYLCLSLDAAKAECRRYLAALEAAPHRFDYPASEE